MYYWIAIIIVILFFPLSIKLSVVYKDGKLHVLIFNKGLILKSIKAKGKSKSVKNSEFKLINFFPNNIRKILYKISNDKHKLSARISFDLNYGFEDASCHCH